MEIPFLKPSQTHRIYGLDILRALAILDIVVGHLLYRIGYYGVVTIFDGVNLFFVLSGFLIGQILIRLLDNGIQFKSLVNFWYRRWMRTLPAYFFILIIICTYHRIIHKLPLIPLSLISFLQKHFFI